MTLCMTWSPGTCVCTSRWIMYATRLCMVVSVLTLMPMRGWLACRHRVDVCHNLADEFEIVQPAVHLRVVDSDS